MSSFSYLTIFVSFFAGITQGLTGFGSALVAMPFFVLILPVKTAVGLSVLNGLVITSILAMRHARDVRPGKVLPLIIGAVPGVLIGVDFLKSADPRSIKMLLGLFLVCYCTYALSRKRHEGLEVKPWWGIIPGFLTGAIGGTFSAGGPPTIVFLSLTNWGKDEIKGTLSVFFLATGVLIALMHLYEGITNGLTLKLFLLNAPFVTMGVGLGMRLYNLLPRELYLRIVLFLLLFLGALLLTGL